MSTTERAAATVPDDWYVWPVAVDWRFDSRLLRLRGESRGPRMIYLDGELLLMTPSQPHEGRKERLGRFVNEVVVGLNISDRPTGSTTWRRASKRGGVEGDLTSYIQSTGAIRGKSRADLRVDPPPDLAIEVVSSHDASNAIEVYRRLGVPEVWVATEQGFRILVHAGNDSPSPRYEPSHRSRAFPVLSADELSEWISRRAPDDDEVERIRQLRAGVSRTLLPRMQRP